MEVQKESILRIVSLLNVLNVRGGLTLEQSHRLFTILQALQDNDNATQVVTLLKELFGFLEIFQRLGKLTLNESFLVYACIQVFLNNKDHAEVMERIVLHAHDFLDTSKI